MVKYAFVVDLTKCMGCRACVEACKIENNTPQGVFWMYVFRFENGEYPNVNVTYLPRPCMHCDNPPCVKVCPVGARYKREDGFVLTDFERCIGCRYCQVACPYGVNYFNWKAPKENQYYSWTNEKGQNVYGSGSIKDYVGDFIPPYKNPDLQRRHGKEKRLTAGGGHFLGVIEKCTWCIHRVEKGLKPACVANCPVEALYFGDISDPNSDVSKLLAKKRWFRLLEDRGTAPSVYYIGSPPFFEGSKELTHLIAKR
ncbi:MAG: 4Fe-4S dicluster domain-containing protein [Nitrososphaerales archaeon]